MLGNTVACLQPCPRRRDQETADLLGQGGVWSSICAPEEPVPRTERWRCCWWETVEAAVVGGGVTDEAFVGGWWSRGAPRTVCTDSKAQSRWSDDDR